MNNYPRNSSHILFFLFSQMLSYLQCSEASHFPTLKKLFLHSQLKQFLSFSFTSPLSTPCYKIDIASFIKCFPFLSSLFPLWTSLSADFAFLQQKRECTLRQRSHLEVGERGRGAQRKMIGSKWSKPCFSLSGSWRYSRSITY